MGGVDWWLADAAAPDTSLPALARVVDAWRRGALADRKSGRRKALYGLRLAGAPGSEAHGTPDHLLKVTRHAGLAAWRRRLRGSKARDELARAEAVAAHGLPTPVPRAAGEWREGGRLRACLLLVPVLADAVDVRARAASPELSAAARRTLAVAFGALARRVADAGLYQEDFAPNNFLVSTRDPTALHVIDFERARLRRPLGPATRRFVLAKLHREMPEASRADRLRFLRAYAGDTDAARRLWRALEADGARLAARDLARMGRTATRPGRRFRPVREGRARGFVRGHDPEALRLAAAEGPPGLAEAGDLLAWREARLGPRQARALWVHQAWLAARGLGAPPRALLRRPGGGTTLVVAPPPGATAPDAAPAESRRAALAVLLARTLALGVLPEAPAAAAVRLAPTPRGTLRAFWVAPPPGLRVRGRPDPGGAAKARRLAALLAGDGPAPAT